MNRYLLLRDNKQTGPYTVAELVEKGLKPYDLVWLDGRSAAWRYPSEIEELKAYAPAVEEQPFDRFYKKPGAEKKDIAQSLSRHAATGHYNNTPQFNQSQAYGSTTAHTSSQVTSQASLQTQEDPQLNAPVNELPTYEAANLQAENNHAAKAVRIEPATSPNINQATTRHINRPSADNINSMAAASLDSPIAENKNLNAARIIDAPSADNMHARAGSSNTPRKIYVNLPGNGKPQQVYTQAPPAHLNRSPEMESPYMPRPIAADSTIQPPVSTGSNHTTGNTNYTPGNLSTGEYPFGSDRSIPGGAQSGNVPKYLSVESRENSFSAKLSADDPYTDKPYTDKVPPTSKIPVIPIGRFNWAITAIGAVCLLLGGVIIGLVISNRNQHAKAELDQLVNQIRERERAKTAVVAPGAALTQTTPVEVSDVEANLPAAAAVESAEEPVTKKEAPRSDKPLQHPAGNSALNTAEKKHADEPVAAVVTDNKPVSVQPAVVREERALNPVAVEAARKNIRQLVSVVNNKYKTGVLGGISDLMLTVTNKSDFELDQVEVEVEYLGPEKRVVKKQIIVFTNIKPGKQLTQEVPRTNRGVTVNTAIRSINSRSLGLASSGL